MPAKSTVRAIIDSPRGWLGAVARVTARRRLRCTFRVARSGPLPARSTPGATSPSLTSNTRSTSWEKTLLLQWGTAHPHGPRPGNARVAVSNLLRRNTIGAETQAS